MWSSYTDAERAQVLDSMVEMGAHWVRLDVAWATFQPDGPDSYSESGTAYVDRVISMAHDRGLRVLVMLWWTPAWAGPDARATPDDPADYANAAGWAAARWADKVDAWEVWNEPNLDDFWADTDPVTYTRLLCAAYPEIKAGDPTAEVVFGGVVHNDDGWIRRAYEAGAKGCFDVLATHPYTAPSDEPATALDTGEIGDYRHVTAVRQVQEDYGDCKPIWFTEVGWSAHENTGTEEPWDVGVTQEQQAQYAVDALELARTDYPYVRRWFWYNERDKDEEDIHQANFGLLERDMTRKPVWYALRDYIAAQPGFRGDGRNPDD
jgi:beta-xylosidase